MERTWWMWIAGLAIGAGTGASMQAGADCGWTVPSDRAELEIVSVTVGGVEQLDLTAYEPYSASITAGGGGTLSLVVFDRRDDWVANEGWE